MGKDLTALVIMQAFNDYITLTLTREVMPTGFLAYRAVTGSW